jgi:tetratricopeptide (TPR) repeat protein/predicted Ser/Thr protein kinase
MTPERWQELDQLLKAALEREQAERAAFLADKCGDDQELRRAAEELLAAQEKMGTFLETPAITSVERFGQKPTPSALPDPAASAISVSDTVLSEEGPLPLARGATLGRYVVLNVIGSGGMGVVYAAYDPELDRKLAIKLMRAQPSFDDSTSGKARLLREAQALARLSHPNVVTVHDVGTLGDDVFIAMEYIEGRTLRQWLTVEARPWREILGVFSLAGRGIAAAHAAGIVHRDFKPDNVLVANNGRVCVLDFGLARRPDDPRGLQLTLQSEVLPEATTRAGGLAVQMTKTGAFMGTPAYMSPEQLSGQPIDAPSDQFSFCAALYEALCGESAFKGDSPRELLSAIKAGRLSEPRKSSQVPAWLRHALVRGLNANPDQRYPSMDALLATLERDPTRRRWRIAGVAAVALLIGATAWSSYGLARQRSQVCRGAEAKLAGVWDDNQKRLLSAAFLTTKKPYATDALRSVNRILDDYAQRWVTMQTQACEATRRGEQSQEMLDLRMACLSHRWEELRSLTRLFAKVDESLLPKSVNAAQGLSDIDDCAKVEVLMAPVKPPADLETRAKVESVRGSLDSIKVLIDSGKYKDALPLATAAVGAADALHYRPVQAEALFYLGLSQTLNGNYKGAEKTLTNAVLAAESAGHDEIAAHAWDKLVTVGSTEAKYEQAELWGKHAMASVDRMGGDDKRLASVLNNLAVVAKDQGKYDEAFDFLRRALAIAEKLNNEAQLSIILNNLGVVLRRQGKYEEALSYYQRALALKEQRLGAAHPDVASTLINIGTLMRQAGKYEEALVYYKRSLAIKEAALGPDHPSLALNFHNMAGIFMLQERYQEGVDAYDKARVLAEKAFGPNHPDVAHALTGMGMAYLSIGAPQKAAPLLERALAIEESHPSERSFLGEAQFQLAKALTELKRQPKRARALALSARETFISNGETSKNDLAKVEEWLARKH